MSFAHILLYVELQRETLVETQRMRIDDGRRRLTNGPVGERRARAASAVAMPSCATS